MADEDEVAGRGHGDELGAALDDAEEQRLAEIDDVHGDPESATGPGLLAGIGHLSASGFMFG